MADAVSGFFHLSGKRALVTGAASGIGRAVAARLEASGAKTLYTDIHAKPPAGLATKAYRRLDVTDAPAFEAIAEDLAADGLDILINNAGVALEEGVIAQSEPTAVRKSMDVNFMGVMYGMKFLAPLVCEGGSIINTASAAALIGVPGYAGYAASKAAVLGLTRVAAMELGPRSVRVNAVCPGTIETPMEQGASAEAMYARKAAALGRIGQTDDLVGLYHFLASDEARYITGQAIVVDGGLSVGVSASMIGMEPC